MRAVAGTLTFVGGSWHDPPVVSHGAPPSVPLARPALWWAYLATTAAIAGLVHLAGRSLTVPHGRLLIPYALPLAGLGFALFALWLTRGWPARACRRALLLDVSIWAAPLFLLVEARPNQLDAPLLLSLTLVLKTGWVLGVLAWAVRSRPVSSEQLAWVLCGVAVVFFLAPLPFTRSALKLKGDEPHYLLATVSLLQDHDLFLENQYGAAGRIPFYDGVLTDSHTVVARAGHRASWHEPGLSILMLLPYQIGGWTMGLVAMAGLAGLVLREIFLAVRALGLPVPAAFAATALVGWSSPFVVYATQIYPEMPAALATAAVARRMITAHAGAGAWPTGLALATLPWLHFRFWALALPLALGALLVWRDRWARVAVLAPLGISTLAYVALVRATYGRWILTPLFVNPELALVGWPAITPARIIVAETRPWLDPYDGLLLLAPIGIYALAALPSLARVPGWAGRVIIGATLSYSGFIGLWYLRSTAGDAPPGRYMVAVLPLLAIGLAYALAHQPAWLNIGLAVPLALAGAANTLVSLWQPLVARYPQGGDGGPIAILSRLTGVPIADVLPSFASPSPRDVGKALLIGAAVGFLAAVLCRTHARAG